MKLELKPLMVSFITVLLMASCTSQTDDKQKNAEKYARIMEDLPTVRVYNDRSFETTAPHPMGVVDPEWSLLDTSVARKNIENSQNIFQIDGKDMPLLADELKYSDISTLSTAASTIVCGGCPNTLRVVRIFYALNNSTLTLYYQAVAACATTKTMVTSANGVLREYNLCGPGKFFRHAGNQFVELNSAQIIQKDVDIAAFQAQTKFRLNISGSYDTFKLTSESDGTGDVKSVVYSIDELSFMCPTNTSKVLLWNSVEKTKVSGQHYSKHSLVISTSNVTIATKKLRIPSTEIFADLAHICPVNCNTFSFHE